MPKNAEHGGMVDLSDHAPEEVKDISRFRALTPEQESVLLSASKLSGCYTEGVVLAKRIEALFRAVPPSLFPHWA